MTREVFTAVPETSFKQLVAVMVLRELDALPVIDPSGRPIGVVAEADALTRLEFHACTDRLPLLASARRRARWNKAHGLTAAELMTRPALTVAETSSLERAVRVMADHAVRRLHVVDGIGCLVGVLTRRDALSVFLRSDSAIRADVESALSSWTTTTRRAEALIDVRVADGVVTLEGSLTLHSTVEQAGVRASHVPGVVAVRNNLRFDVDDLLITGM
jgi:CBS-domain-containing membrane protein